VSYFDAGYEKLDPKISFDLSIKDNYIKILRPRYLSLSSKNIFFYNTAHLTQKSFERAVYGALPYLDDVPPTILYGHFLYQSGAAAVRIASKLRIPSCVAVGESSFWSVAPIGYKKAIKDFRDVDRVIAVSSVIKKMLIQELMIPKEQICVLPNGVDLSLFYPRNSKEMRKQFAFPIDKFIIAFNGASLKERDLSGYWRQYQELKISALFLLVKDLCQLRVKIFYFKVYLNPRWYRKCFRQLTFSCCQPLLRAPAMLFLRHLPADYLLLLQMAFLMMTLLTTMLQSE